MVFDTFIGIPVERDIFRGDFQVGLRLGYIGSVQVDIEVVALGVRVGGALSPGY